VLVGIFRFGPAETQARFQRIKIVFYSIIYLHYLQDSGVIETYAFKHGIYGVSMQEALMYKVSVQENLTDTYAVFYL